MQIDRHGHNRNWGALGYCGPDPEVFNRNRDSTSTESIVIRPADDRLKERVVEGRVAGSNLIVALENVGIKILDNVSHLKGLVRRRVDIEKNASSLNSLGDSGGKEEVGVSCDVVVVGSGCGGGVVASAIAKWGYKVVVLEKGKYFGTEDFSGFEGPSQMAMYEKLGSLATEDGGVNLVAGIRPDGSLIASYMLSTHQRRMSSPAR